MRTEVEVKLPVSSFDEILEKALKFGFSKKESVIEEDWYFENEEKYITKNHAALRIRKTENIDTKEVMYTLNFKGKKMDTVSMSRPEFETKVSSFEDTLLILKSLSFEPVDIKVIKKRNLYEKEDISLCFDEVEDLGLFLEVEIITEEEKKEEALNRIEKLLHQFSYRMTDTITTSYLSLLIKNQKTKKEKQMEKMKVEFKANYMKATVGDITLYAEANASFIGMFPAEFGQSNPDFKKAVFPVLRDEIIRQAIENNIDPDLLEFVY